jgi:holo-[acyl-carrier protein] synthase
MIYGVGTDLVEVDRVRRLLERYGERFARRILGPREWADFERSPNRAVYLSGRYAAKEAFAKAFGTGLRHPVSLTNINVTRDPLGKPNLWLEAELEALLASRGVTGRHLSVTHEHSMACAFVVLEAGGTEGTDR